VVNEAVRDEATRVEETRARRERIAFEARRVIELRQMLDRNPLEARRLLVLADAANVWDQMRQERDRLAFDSARRLGEVARARTLGQRFVSTYPEHPNTRRIQTWLDEH
jgi:hypothetical protein